MDKIINCLNKDKKQVGTIEFKNMAEDKGEIYIYGEITSGSDKWDETDVILSEFKDNLDSFKDKKELNIYINSPGGSVNVGNAMLNQLKRHPATKNMYVDSIAASIASVILMAYDNLYIYNTSQMMVHKPAIGINWGGNANDLRKTAETLDRFEENTLLPAYMDRTTEELTEDNLKAMLNNETWLGSKDIQKYFKDVTILENNKELVACIKDVSILNNYKNVPESIKSTINKGKGSQEDKQKEGIELEYLKARLELELL